MPFISCILLSHDKPEYVGEAINSLLAQTFLDWEAIVFDSGVLHDRGFFATLPAMSDPRIRLVRSWETEELRATKTVASWCFNECFRKQLLCGQYVTYLCDDDLYYPQAFAVFHEYLTANSHVRAAYASIDMTAVSADGEKFVLRELLADEMKGSNCGGGALDCQVDYLQLCHEASLFDPVTDIDFWPEDRAVIQHADGIFLEKIGSRTPIHPIAAKVGENRKVPVSLNTGGERLHLLVEVSRREKEIRRLERLVLDQERELVVLRRNNLSHHCLRYRLVDQLNAALQRVPVLHGMGKKLVTSLKR